MSSILNRLLVGSYVAIASWEIVMLKARSNGGQPKKPPSPRVGIGQSSPHPKRQPMKKKQKQNEFEPIKTTTLDENHSYAIARLKAWRGIILAIAVCLSTLVASIYVILRIQRWFIG